WKSAGRGEAAWEEKGDRSFWAILPGFLVVFFAPPIEWMYLPAVLPRTLWMQIAGLVLILAAVALRIWTRAHLRGLYSGHVEVQVGHRLVQSGPYLFVRHPGYTGFLLMTLGVAIGYSSLIGLAAVLVLLLPGLAYRMQVEERLLIEQFGEEYRAYALKTRQLIPFVW
ncbi:MAG: isoprenylcysteine carboxylmethyltransferase family protein, partial [Anaerolineales bacterium]|nr:isoprenylcysteine carboxylmethyltransferase family protein [Anaerolineales bacterium]